MTEKRPVYILAASPKQPVRLTKFFESGKDTPMMILQNPGEKRYGGWDLQTLSTPQIIEGKYLEIVNGERKIIRLYEDSTFIVRGIADHTFLGWSNSLESFLRKARLNPIALIEFTYNFADLYARIVQLSESMPSEYLFRVGLDNMFFMNVRLRFAPYPLNSIGGIMDSESKEAPANVFSRELDIKKDVVINNPARVAYLLIREVYRWFGHTDDKIQYTSGAEEDKVIDFEKIRNAN